MNRGCIGAITAAMLLAMVAPAADRKAATDSLVQPLVDTGAVPGVVVAVLEDGKTQVFGYGKMTDAASRVPDAATLFEIGSVTKTFTALALAEMVQRKMLALDDPVRRYLPADIAPPTKEGEAEIRLVDLASQTSGLPGMPANFQPKDQANPYADYTPQMLYEYLAKQTLARKLNAGYLYSNLGVGLLGHALSLRYGKSYEQMVTELITTPLGLRDTRVTLTLDEQARFAQGHDPDSKPVHNWDIPTLAGAGALRSTATDLLHYLDAQLNPPEKLKPAIDLTHRERAKIGPGPAAIALAWHIKPDGKTYWHNGGTAGYTTYVSFNTERKTGVVVLLNAGGQLMNQVGDRMERMLAGQTVEPLKLHLPVTLESKVLDEYVGVYELGPNVRFTVSREGNQLSGQVTGQRQIHVYPEAKDQFFIRFVEATVTFNRDAEGKVIGLVLHQNGRDGAAKKVQ